MRRASAGTGVVLAGPTAEMRPPRTTTVAFLSGRSPVMVSTVTLVMANGSGSGPDGRRQERTPVAAASSRAGDKSIADLMWKLGRPARAAQAAAYHSIRERSRGSVGACG